jgi:hypothetical protein
MDQPIDPNGTGACAKRTLGPIVRTGLLLSGAVLASVLAVDLPAADRAAEPYVPASGPWIELGAEATEEVSDPRGLTPSLQHRS